MADLTTIVAEGAFDGTVRSQINANFTALNSGGGGSILHQAMVTLDNDEIIALPTTPVTIVAAPGTGLVIVPQTMVVRTTFPNQTDYSNVNAEAYFSVGLGTNADICAFLPAGRLTAAQLTDHFSASALAIFTLPAADVTSGSYFYTADVANVVCTIGMVNADGPLEDGDTENTMVVSLAYLLLNTSTGLFE